MRKDWEARHVLRSVCYFFRHPLFVDPSCDFVNFPAACCDNCSRCMFVVFLRVDACVVVCQTNVVEMMTEAFGRLR